MLRTTAIALFLMGLSALAQDRPAQRQKNQQARIAEGVQSGELTKKEARRLERKERKLHREVRKDRVDGGGLSAREKAKIEAKQDAISADIAKQKHDAQKQK